MVKKTKTKTKTKYCGLKRKEKYMNGNLLRKNGASISLTSNSTSRIT